MPPKENDSDNMHVPWKWIAATFLSLLLLIAGGAVSYFLSSNASQITELKGAISQLRAQSSAQQICIAEEKVKLEALKRRVRALERFGTRLGSRMGVHLPLPKKK